MTIWQTLVAVAVIAVAVSTYLHFTKEFPRVFDSGGATGVQNDVTVNGGYQIDLDRTHSVVVFQNNSPRFGLDQHVPFVLIIENPNTSPCEIVLDQDANNPLLNGVRILSEDEDFVFFLTIFLFEPPTDLGLPYSVMAGGMHELESYYDLDNGQVFWVTFDESNKARGKLVQYDAEAISKSVVSEYVRSKADRQLKKSVGNWFRKLSQRREAGKLRIVPGSARPLDTFLDNLTGKRHKSK